MGTTTSKNDCEAAIKATADLRNNMVKDGKMTQDQSLSWYWDEVMQKICLRESPADVPCPDGKGPCSSMVTCKFCQDWARDTDLGKESATKHVNEWCGKNPKDPGCVCYSSTKALSGFYDPTSCSSSGDGDKKEDEKDEDEEEEGGNGINSKLLVGIFVGAIVLSIGAVVTVAVIANKKKN